MKECYYMSKEHTNSLRGIFAVLVVFHHIYQYSGLFRETYIGTVLQLSGFLSVAMFFFFSGYGLMFSSTKDNYIENFFRKRFLPLYCFYIVLIILYTLWTLLLEKTVSFKEILLSFFFGETIVTNGWYLQATFVLYLIYFLIFKFFKKPKIQFFSFSVFVIVYCVFCYLIDLGINWYQTFPCVLLGIVFCYNKKWVDALLKKHSYTVLILSSILFVLCYILSRLNSVGIIFAILYSLFFVCTMISFSYILCNTPILNNKVFALLGKYSFEIYVSHGFFLRLIKYIENVFIYILVVILGTIVVSIIMKVLYTKIVFLFVKHE